MALTSTRCHLRTFSPFEDLRADKSRVFLGKERNRPRFTLARTKMAYDLMPGCIGYVF